MKHAVELAKKYQQWALEQKAKREQEQDGSQKRGHHHARGEER
jgi:hypothetical protein